MYSVHVVYLYIILCFLYSFLTNCIARGMTHPIQLFTYTYIYTRFIYILYSVLAAGIAVGRMGTGALYGVYCAIFTVCAERKMCVRRGPVIRIKLISRVDVYIVYYLHVRIYCIHIIYRYIKINNLTSL